MKKRGQSQDFFAAILTADGVTQLSDAQRIVC